MSSALKKEDEEGKCGKGGIIIPKLRLCDGGDMMALQRRRGVMVRVHVDCIFEIFGGSVSLR